MIALTLLTIASAGSLVLAVPTKTTRSPGPITLPMVTSGNATASYWHDLLYSDNETADGSITLTKRAGTTSRVTYKADSGAYFYAVPITIGAGKTGSVDTVTQIDTGSSDLWSTDYKGATGTNPGATGGFQITYGSGGGAQGTSYTDSITMGGLTATGERVAAATSGQGNRGTSGIMGMSWIANSVQQSVPFVQQLFNQGQIPAQRFGSVMSLDGKGPELFLGGVDTSRLYSTLTAATLTYQAYWTIPFDGIKVGATTLAGGDAIIDTGSVFISGPTNLVQKVYDNIPGAMLESKYLQAQGMSLTQDQINRLSSSWVLPCGPKLNQKLGTRVSNPSFIISGRSFVVPYVSLVGVPYFRYVVNADRTAYMPPLNGQYYCESLLIGNGAFANTAQDSNWNFGVPFQYHLYADYDYSGAGGKGTVSFDYSI